MIKKIITIILAGTLVTVLSLGIAACSPDKQVMEPTSNSDIEINDSSDVSDTNEETSLISISAEASKKLKALISDGDYSGEVFLRVDTVKGYG